MVAVFIFAQWQTNMCTNWVIRVERAPWCALPSHVSAPKREQIDGPVRARSHFHTQRKDKTEDATMVDEPYLFVCLVLAMRTIFFLWFSPPAKRLRRRKFYENDSKSMAVGERPQPCGERACMLGGRFSSDNLISRLTRMRERGA